jgi:hypothetical protein
VILTASTASLILTNRVEACNAVLEQAVGFV